MMRERGLDTSYIDRATPTVVLVAGPADGDDATAAIDLVGYRLLDRFDWHDADDRLARLAAHPIVAIEAAGVADAVLADMLPAIAALADARDLPLIATLTEPQIDLVASYLLGGRAQLLCTPTIPDRLVALTIAGSAGEAMVLSDTWRESETARLRRLNEEVARLADTLAQFMRDQHAPGVPDDIRDHRPAYHAGPEVAAPPAHPRGRGVVVGAADVRQAIRARRLRDRYFGAGLFEDPAWDMLLDLYAADLEGTPVSVSSLCIAAAVASTTALRWIAKLTDGGLFERRPDPADRRRAFVALAPQTRTAMRAYMLEVHRTDLRIA